MIQKIFICDLCGKSNKVPDDYDYRTGITGYPINKKSVCKNCLKNELKKSPITEKQKKQIERIFPKEDKQFHIESACHVTTLMRTTELNKISSWEADKIIRDEKERQASLKKWKEDNPICAKHGCDFESLGFEGLLCRRCNGHLI